MDEHNKKNRPTQKDWDELLLKVGECMRDHALLIGKTAELAAIAKLEAEHKPLPKKKKTVWIAVSPECKLGMYRQASSAYELKDGAETSFPNWPVYPLEIECDE